MSENNGAIIQFIGYRVSNIDYFCDPAFEFPEGDISYMFHFSKSLSFISETEIQENLKVVVFYSEDKNIDNASFRLSISISGRFMSEAAWQPEWEINALAILFPYLRGLVSMITANSGRPPIILPTMNIANMFTNKS